MSASRGGAVYIRYCLFERTVHDVDIARIGVTGEDDAATVGRPAAVMDVPAALAVVAAADDVAEAWSRVSEPVAVAPDDRVGPHDGVVQPPVA